MREELKLSLQAPSFEICRLIVWQLHNMGYHAHSASPRGSEWDIVVTCSPEVVNLGTDMFDELKNAYVVAQALLYNNESEK